MKNDQSRIDSEWNAGERQRIETMLSERKKRDEESERMKEAMRDRGVPQIDIKIPMPPGSDKAEFYKEQPSGSAFSGKSKQGDK